VRFALLAALRKLRKLPDLLFCDGQGYAHPRIWAGMPFGVLLDRATIGCAKSCWWYARELGKERVTGCFGDEGAGERIGAWCGREEECGRLCVASHRVTWRRRPIDVQVADVMRIPRPTREADLFASERKQRLCDACMRKTIGVSKFRTPAWRVV